MDARAGFAASPARVLGGGAPSAAARAPGGAGPVAVSAAPAVLAVAVLLGGGCGPWPAPVAPRLVAREVSVAAASIAPHQARFVLGPPLGGELVFDLPRCEWAGSGAMRVDRACVGTFTLRTPRGSLQGGARSLWSGYRTLVALHGDVRVGTGCFAGVDSGAVERSGPVSFPRLPVRLRLRTTRPVTGDCATPPGSYDVEALVRAARAQAPGTSAVALRALATALAAPGDGLRAAAAVALGYAAPAGAFRVFRAALAREPGLLAQAEGARELRGPGDLPPSRCDAEAGDAGGPEAGDAAGLAGLCAAARLGFAAARAPLATALAAPARLVRREAATLLVRLGGARARDLLEPAAAAALRRGDLAAAVDLAEALLLAGDR